MATILVTGATGFVGRHLCRFLAASGLDVLGAARNAAGVEDCPGLRLAGLSDNSSVSELEALMEGVDCVVHLAARAHVMAETSSDPLSDYLRVNLGGTEAVARAAVKAGVRRFIFLSSIKVLGEASGDRPFREVDVPNPVDPYGVSKLMAEQFLAGLADSAGLETVIIRPPLVYGSGVRGNFLRMLKLVACGIPMPFGSISNARSMIAVQNLCDAIRVCLSHPAAAGRRFLVSDNEDVSTPELFRLLASKMGMRSRLLPFPVGLLRTAGAIARRSAEIARLCESLRIDMSLTREAIGWAPPMSLEQGITEVAEWYLGARESRRV